MNGHRMLTVWWAHWPIVAAGATRSAAIVLKANRVVACSPAAAADGVAIGQRRRIAQQRCPGAVLLDDDPDRDARMFEPVVRAVGKFTPRLEMVEPGWLCVESRGPSRYFGGDDELVTKIVAAVDAAVDPGTDPAELRAGPRAGLGVGIADGRFASAVAARIAARRNRSVVVATGGSRAFLAPEPVAWLHETGEVDAEFVGLLARLGLARLGMLADLDRVDVAGRFGPPGEHAHRLACADDARPSLATEPPAERMVERVLDDPVDQLQPLVFIGKQLADDLVAELTMSGLVCTRVVVTSETEFGERSERVWYRANGLSAPAIVERVRWQLEGWVNQPGGLSSGVVLLRLDPDELRHDRGDQLRLWGGLSEADERAVRAVTRLAGMAGEQAVLVPAWQGGRLPGDRYRWVPATTTDLTDPDDTAQRLRPFVGGSPAGGVAPSGAPTPLSSLGVEGGFAGARRAVAGGSAAPGGAPTPTPTPTPASPGRGTRRRGSPVGVWPGSLPAPSPSIVLDGATRAAVTDKEGAMVVVGGRGELNATPVSLVIGEREPQEITGWAGPWPVDEWWWDERRHRRLARFQIVTADGAAHLVAVERQRWWVLASYG
jgi:protein ImuB